MECHTFLPNEPPHSLQVILLAKGVGIGGVFACAAGEFCLDHAPGDWGDDGFVVAGDVVLGYFAFVDFHGFVQEVGSEALLEQRVAFVFLVGQDRLHSRGRPDLFATRCRNLISGEFFGDGLMGCAF